MSQAISGLTGAQIHYHTEVLTCGKWCALAGAGFAGLTGCVAGVLILLRYLPFPITTAHACLGGGLTVLTGDAIALLVLKVKDSNAKKFKEFYVGAQSDQKEWWDKVMLETMGSDQPDTRINRYFTFHDNAYVKIIYGIIKREGKAYSVHLFDENQISLYAKMLDDLKEEGFEDREGHYRVD